MEYNSSSSSSSTSHPSMKELNKRAEILSRQILRMPVTDDNDVSEVTGMSSQERNEQFVQMLNAVEAEVSAYDEANMRAMETYFRKVWSKVPFFGKHAKKQLQEESVKEVKVGEGANVNSSFIAQAMQEHTNTKSDKALEKTKSKCKVPNEPFTFASHNVVEQSDHFTSATNINSSGNTNNAVASGTFAGERLRTTRSRTTSGHLVERTSICETDNWSSAANSSYNATNCKGNGSSNRLTNSRHVGLTNANRKVKVDSKPAEFRTSWLFKQRHPNWVPLMQRWWIPWLCVGSIALIWTPDVWKLRVLYLCDYQYAQLRQSIHIAYWRLTMKPDDFAELMASIEAERPSSVKGTACPFE